MRGFNQQSFSSATGAIQFDKTTTAEAPRAFCAACITRSCNPEQTGARDAETVFDVVVSKTHSYPQVNGWSWAERTQLRSYGCRHNRAHGFVVLSQSADFLYKTDYYAPARALRYKTTRPSSNWPLAQTALPRAAAVGQTCRVVAGRCLLGD
jgi:hypothetical protein